MVWYGMDDRRATCATALPTLEVARNCSFVFFFQLDYHMHSSRKLSTTYFIDQTELLLRRPQTAPGGNDSKTRRKGETSFGFARCNWSSRLSDMVTSKQGFRIHLRCRKGLLAVVVLGAVLLECAFDRLIVSQQEMYIVEHELKRLWSSHLYRECSLRRAD